MLESVASSRTSICDMVKEALLLAGEHTVEFFINALTYFAVPSTGTLETVTTVLVVHEGLIYSFLRGLDERTVLNDWLVQNLSTDYHEVGLLRVLGNRDLDSVTVSLEENSVELRDDRIFNVQRSFKNVEESVVISRNFLDNFSTWLNSVVVVVNRGVCKILDRLDSIRLTTDNLDFNLIVRLSNRDLSVSQVTVTRISMLQIFWKVNPKLHSLHIGTILGVWHLRVADTFTCSHELQITSIQNTSRSSEVLMEKLTFHHKSDCLLSSVGVIREPCVWTHIEMIQHKERREVSHAHGTN
ncbi:hypothetical protein OGAPHI_004888 [Ogataea philodendri]|uniref:Uncharacterized protein n=1 Tax=Ogataea philodendri TaxID=1378263 RepID=A0A9P8T3H1_9ASCO|nr:uncharacterized protein OGAPHI_004888 [Ogataea philodendri]KAH3664174.1 hypothetical protein OGAPHI_004888 [Ogataea philodendri]